MSKPLYQSRPHEPVRVKHAVTGHHFTTTRHLAQEGGHTLLTTRPATDRDGAWLPIKYNLAAATTISPDQPGPDASTPDADVEQAGTPAENE